ncbi:hypothetical protein B9Z55_029099 [Caenorhabditis nigoni]|uniref:Uncharacterized protein n=1 Tax=Caenorhabditis nigoni TaxID=1611254 RepID=A0A2G5S8S2_9PELO|nr:hypothetical protein B9Z55_029099 [Caenorhabditis nigoni]
MNNETKKDYWKGKNEIIIGGRRSQKAAEVKDISHVCGGPAVGRTKAKTENNTKNQRDFFAINFTSMTAKETFRRFMAMN